jgi:cytochrome c553
MSAIKRRLAAVFVVVAGTTLMAAMGTPPVARASTHGSGRSVWDSVFTLAQATRGETAYVKTCARCHKASLGGADESPPLIGGEFLGNWNGQSLGALHDRIRTSMPTDDPGTYGRQLITDVMAYVLKVNQFPAGAIELPSAIDSLKEIRMEAAKP